MSDDSAPSRAPGRRAPDDRSGVRTYRGRTVEELIPRIRAELGPDAIILREREGLTGGIGGFFAQRCVEIDAQAAPRLSVYDDDFDADDEEYAEYAEYDEDDALEEPEVEAPPPPQAEAPPPPQAEAPASPRPAGPPPPHAQSAASSSPETPPPPSPAAPARPASPFLDEASFAARLEEATFAADQAPDPEPRYAPAPSAAPPLFIAFDELGEDQDTPPVQTPEPTPRPIIRPVIDLADLEHSEPEPRHVARPKPAVAAHPEAAPEPTPAAEAEPSSQPEARSAPAESFRLAPPSHDTAPDPKAPWMAFAAEAPLSNGTAMWRPPAPPAASAAPPPLAPPAPQTPRPRPVQHPPSSHPSQTEPARQVSPAAQPPAQPMPYSGPTALPAAGPPAPGSPTWPAPAGAPNLAWPGGPGYGARRRAGLLPAAERVLRAALEATAAANERRNLELQARAFPGAPPIQGQTQTQIPSQPQPPAAGRPHSQAPTTANDSNAAAAPPSPAVDAEAQRREEHHRRETELERRLIRAGISPHRAAALVAGAISRRGPLPADGELAGEVRRALVAALPAPRTLPKHSAIAIVGAGGSGKTRCVAALASAYSGAGVAVSVASFGSPTREDELGELLHGENVNVIPAMRTRATARAVSSAREHSLVIIDTASASPRDESTIDVIAEALHSFRLDAIYLAVPATLSLPAALKLVDSFSAFDLAGMVASHVDESDQLGMIAELSMQTGIPVVYTHTGLDLQTAIASADAEAIATSVL